MFLAFLVFLFCFLLVVFFDCTLEVDFFQITFCCEIAMLAQSKYVSVVIDAVAIHVLHLDVWQNLVKAAHFFLFSAHFTKQMPVLFAVRRCDAIVDFHTLCDLFDEKIGACADEHDFSVRIAIFGFEKVIDVFLVFIPILFDGFVGVDKADKIECDFLKTGTGSIFVTIKNPQNN